MPEATELLRPIGVAVDADLFSTWFHFGTRLLFLETSRTRSRFEAERRTPAVSQAASMTSRRAFRLFRFIRVAPTVESITSKIPTNMV